MRAFLVLLIFLLAACSQDPDVGRIDYNMGMKLIKGIGAPKNEVEGIRHLTLASEAGNGEAMVTLGYFYLQGTGVLKDEVKAFTLFERAAKQGNRDGQYNAGLSYIRGIGTNVDLEEAFRWFRKAALQDDVGSQYNIGVMYMNGEGVTKDLLLAYAWFAEADSKQYEGAKDAMDTVRRSLDETQLTELDRTMTKVSRSIVRQPSIDLSVGTGEGDQPL
ncbi:sel1 repeat family protein [Candidatus Peribacteria bacterium]|nr:sel1 repeat family protein [Candidatus Peribacteria bacterium]